MSIARARSRGAIDDFLARLPRLTLILGKGGVGKTTCAIGAAALCAANGERTLLLSTDPADALGPALNVALANGECREVRAGLWAMQLDPIAARERFLTRWRDVLVTIIDRGTYLDVEDIGGLVDAAFPGTDEIFGLLVLAELFSSRNGASMGSDWQRIVIDTAPTGHTLRLLALPETFDALIALLDAMQAKHRFMVSALTHRYRRDAADGFLETMRATIGALRLSLGDARRSGAVLVTRAEPVVLRETERYAKALSTLGISLIAVLVEALPRNWQHLGENPTTLRELAALAPERGLFAVPEIEPPPAGVAESASALGRVKYFGEGTVASARKGLRSDSPRRISLKRGGRVSPPRPVDRTFPLGTLLRTLTIVGGKGGVGKTTVSCALALYAAFDDGRPGDVLLVSTDPAPSVGDALGIQAPQWAHTSPESLETIPRLHIWQMDATEAFQQLRDRYRDRIDDVFDSLTGRSFDIAHDRAILRDLLALAPPGIDELYALASLGEKLEERRYTRIIIDPAPTGHLLRLLQLPALAIDWSHRLMRLMLKYKEIAPIGHAAQDLLTFAKRTSALDRMLHDQSRAGVVLVSLDEPVVRAETLRLTNLLRASGIAVLGEVRNRVMTASASDTSPMILAPAVATPLIGVATIREWSWRWTRGAAP